MRIKEKVKKIKKFARDERTLEILEAIAKLGGIVFIVAVCPNGVGAIMKMLGWAPDWKNKYRTKRVVDSLKKRNFIKFWIKDGKGKIKLTHKGRIYFAGLKVKLIKLPHQTNWDGRWRIVSFDIPEKLKINRQRFGRALNFAGMYNFERSFFVYPHECKEQVFKIAELYEVKKYVHYILAQSVEPDFKLKNNFPYTKSTTIARPHN